MTVLTVILVAASVWVAVPSPARPQRQSPVATLAGRDALLVAAVLLALGPVAAALAALVLRVVLPRLSQGHSAAALGLDDAITVADYIAVCCSAGLTIGQAVGHLANARIGQPSRWAADVIARHEMGLPLGQALRTSSTEHPLIEDVARVLGRAYSTGAPVASRLHRLAASMRRHRRGELTRRVRTLSVRAVVPLGVCFLPAFVLLAVVPLAAAFTAGLSG